MDKFGTVTIMRWRGRFGVGALPVVTPPDRLRSRGHVVLLLASGNPTFSGGVPGQVVSRAKYLLAHNFEVTIIARGNPEWQGEQTIDGVRVFALRPKDFKLGKWIAKQWFHPLLGAAIAQFLPKLHATIPINCILVFDSQTGIPAIRFGRKRSIPVLFLVHGTALDPVSLPELLRRMSLRWEHYCYFQADLVAPVSKAILETYRASFGECQKIKILPNAFSPVFEPRRNHVEIAQNFVFVGRFEEDKRPLNALKAALKLPEISLRIIGDGSQRKVITDLANSSRSVWISEGNIADRKALRDHYHWGHCFIWVSAAESFGVAPLEAIACGQIVIAPRIPAALELLGEDYELVVEVDDLPGLLEAIRRVRTEPELVARCRLRCEEVITRFSEKRAFGDLICSIEDEIEVSSRDLA